MRIKIEGNSKVGRDKTQVHLTYIKFFFQIIAFDELKTDYKNPIDQCNSLNPLVLPEYILHAFFNLLFLVGGEFFSLFLNVPLIGYHVHRYLHRPGKYD